MDEKTINLILLIVLVALFLMFVIATQTGCIFGMKHVEVDDNYYPPENVQQDPYRTGNKAFYNNPAMNRAISGSDVEKGNQSYSK